jgi:hypothetical protein
MYRPVSVIIKQEELPQCVMYCEVLGNELLKEEKRNSILPFDFVLCLNS